MQQTKSSVATKIIALTMGAAGLACLSSSSTRAPRQVTADAGPPVAGSMDSSSGSGTGGTSGDVGGSGATPELGGRGGLSIDARSDTAGADTGTTDGKGRSDGAGGLRTDTNMAEANGTADDARPPDPPITPRVNNCSGLAAAGVFEEITPPEVKAGRSSAKDGGGTFALAADPVNLGTIYVGTRYQKLWKSTDCGATWTNLSASPTGKPIGTGMNWTLAVDPQAPDTVYTNSGYGGSSNGLYKSTDGGSSWTEIWPPPGQPELGKAFTYNFVNVIAIDPSDHQHLLLTFHETCLAPHPATCIAESMNAGATWRLLDGRPNWNGNEGQVIFFLNDSATWLWGSQSSGFWRTDNSGGSWDPIPGMTTSHLQGSQLVRTKAGHFYQAGADGIWHSPDGKAANWKLVANTGPIVGGLVATGTNLYASTCYFAGVCNPRYLTSPETDGQTWTAMKSPTLDQGGTMAYDPGHKLLYSSNLTGGLWRVVAP